MRCKAFEIVDPQKAWEHMKFEFVKDYGDRAYGHFLHTWDDGERYLVKCKTCGGYILVQKSEFHGYEDDDYYTDYFPVENEQEAEWLNKMYDGFQLESASGLKYLICDFGRPCHWSIKEEKEEKWTWKKLVKLFRKHEKQQA